MIKFEGRLLLFDKTDDLGYRFSKECHLHILDTLPILFENKFCGMARVIRDERGLIAKMEVDDKDNRLSNFCYRKIGIGGGYRLAEKHFSDKYKCTVVDEATLLYVVFTDRPVDEAYYMIVSKEEM